VVIDISISFVMYLVCMVMFESTVELLKSFIHMPTAKWSRITLFLNDMFCEFRKRTAYESEFWKTEFDIVRLAELSRFEVVMLPRYLFYCPQFLIRTLEIVPTALLVISFEVSVSKSWNWLN